MGKHWTGVDMRRDWNQVFPSDQRCGRSIERGTI